MTDQNSPSQATSTAEHSHDAQSTDERAGKGARGSSPNSRLSNEKTADEEDAISIAHSQTSTAPTVRSKQGANTTRPATLTRATSVTPDAIIIPRAQRRGLLARFTLIPEVQNPYHYARPTKWFLTFIVAFCAMAAPMGSAIVMPVLREISIAFGASHTITNMSVAVYMLSMAIFPLFWSSLSERLGRRTVYIASFILFIIFGILSAVSQSISMLIVMRTLSGGAAASVQAVGAGTIADIWEVRERGKAMGIFYLGPLCGPLFAPIIGGALGAGLGWRSTQWFLVIYGSATLIFIIVALPETLAAKEKLISTEIQADGKPHLARTSTRASTIAHTKTVLSHLRQIFIDPLAILAWLRFPPVALTVYYASITFGSLYILNISIQSTFAAPPYSFSTLIVGLVSLFSTNLVSAICSFLILITFVHNHIVLFRHQLTFFSFTYPTLLAIFSPQFSVGVGSIPSCIAKRAKQVVMTRAENSFCALKIGCGRTHGLQPSCGPAHSSGMAGQLIKGFIGLYP
jgi:multidrug resistance protein